MKTTQANFELFKSECRKWIEFWGINDRDVHYEYKKDTDIAWCAYNDEAKIYYLGLTKDWQGRIPKNDYEIKKCAFHEVVEMLIAPGFDLIDRKYITKEEVEKERHSLIMTIQNAVFK